MSTVVALNICSPSFHSFYSRVSFYNTFQVKIPKCKRSCFQKVYKSFFPLFPQSITPFFLVPSGAMQISTETTAMSERQECSGCKKKITDRYLLKAMDQFWHEDCLKCSCCDCRLGEVGSTLFTKANLMLCRRDYLR